VIVARSGLRTSPRGDRRGASRVRDGGSRERVGGGRALCRRGRGHRAGASGGAGAPRRGRSLARVATQRRGLRPAPARRAGA
jgi:hypothetical protein